MAEPKTEDGRTLPAQEAADQPAVPRRGRRESRVWRRTTMRRAIIEGALIFAAGRLLAMVPIELWPAALFPLVLIARFALQWVLPPFWAAQRVVSTRREKMSRRFWWLGPQLALLCTVVDVVIALALGEASFWGGAAGRPDLARLATHGADHLSATSFVATEGTLFFALLVYHTIAVVCTRLANGGFMRFTMPAGNGRVTL